MSTKPSHSRSKTTAAAPSKKLQHTHTKNAASVAHRSSAYLASLRETRMLDSSTQRAALPAEILERILDFLPVPELLTCARTSKRMKDMVYEDARWVQKLKILGCWNEEEARRRKRAENQRNSREVPTITVNGPSSGRKSSVVFTGTEHSATTTHTNGAIASPTSLKSPENEFEAMALSGVANSQAEQKRATPTTLNVLSQVRSIRGQARQEYGKVYGALASFYFDLVQPHNRSDPKVFRTYREPEYQARMLSQLRTFAKGDFDDGWKHREETLESMIAVFENAVLREFEQGYEMRDVDGKMKKYGHVLVTLNGGAAAIDLYIHNNPLMQQRSKLGRPLACLESSSGGQADLAPARDFFQRLVYALNEESATIERAFPKTTNVFIPFLDRINDDIIADYVTALFDEAHTGNIECYLKIVSGIYEQTLQFVMSLTPPKGSSEDFTKRATSIVNRCFGPHVDLYLAEELDHFKRRANAQVDNWKKRLTEQEASAESFFMSNINRQAVKQDFMTSFKKVVMMPVSVFPTFSAGSPASKAHEDVAKDGRTGALTLSTDVLPERSASPRQAPNTELAAKAALMNSKLEGISTLFSVEIALNLVHEAKASLERAAVFVNIGGHQGAKAREQCEAIFVELLRILGSRHVKPGFDRAVEHLSSYKAREAVEHSQTKVRPLTTFLELVNVGDLIQQMVDVFYVQELVSNKLTDEDDFLNPAAKEKKRFEQVLDERVAAGLNKGIEVLMDEVEYISSTSQSASDFNPGTGDKDAVAAAMDIGPTSTAVMVVDLVSSHTSMLTGSTDKNTLDVFNQEVGLRLFAALCKHIKRQRISTDGAIKLISDTNHYFTFIQAFRNKELLLYFTALREVAQIFLVEPTHAKEIATIIADADRYHGIFHADEVLEFAERRADWYQIRYDVEKAMYGLGCLVM